jgi:cytidine deaminase
MKKNYAELIRAARKAVKNAYAPYSGFKVGAAVLAGSGKIYAGANVENASYGLTVCAERIAVYNAVVSGEKKITAAAVAAGSGTAYPCGACRQVLSEFGKNIDVIIVKKNGHAIKKLSSLLPDAFR